MAEGVRCSLLRCLEHLTPEELQKFKLYLQDHPAGRGIPWGRLEGADREEVAALLIHYQGEQEAWELALSLWEKMGLRLLWERARAEGPQGTAEEPKLKRIQDERNDYQERMRKKFQHIRDRNSQPREHELFQHQFTQLLFLQTYRYKEEKGHELRMHGSEHAKVMKGRGQFKDVSALFDPDPETGDPTKTVVFQGAAGIGKTTLARKVMLDWAKGKLYQKQFDWVFFLNCRELNPLGERKTSFADLISNEWPGPQAPMTEIMSKAERLLFIIDGLDELKFPCNEHKYDLCKDWKQQRPVPILMSSLLRKTLLPKASLLLTTRLTALGKFSPLLENAHHVEILGFSEEHRKEFFCKYFKDEDLGEKAFNVVKDNDILFTMCSVPLMSWIVCTCLKQQMKSGQDPLQALKTTTALYMYYLSNLMPPNDKTFVSQHLRALCCLAVEGIWERKLLFDEEDLRRHGLGAADISAFLDLNIFQKDIDCENCYSFIHLSFQEFFAAMFYVMPSTKEEMDVTDSSIPVKKLLGLDNEYAGNFVMQVVRFLFGFLNMDTARQMEKKFRCRMSTELKSQLLQWIKGQIRCDYVTLLEISDYILDCYSCLYETQNDEFVTEVLQDTEEVNIIVDRILDVLIAVFILKLCTKARSICFVSSFHLPVGVWKDLFFAISKNQSLEEINFEGYDCDEACMELHCVEQKNRLINLEALRYKSLKREPVNSDCLEEDGMKLPCETFGNNSQLETLRINGIRCLLFMAFSSHFLINENLKSVELVDTDLGELEINLLCKALEKQGCKIETLRLESCEVTTPLNYKNLFSALQSNQTLKTLDLSNNSFEEGEITVLSKALANTNFKLGTLRLESCKVTTPLGYKNFFFALNNNKSLKTLDLSYNSFEEEEIKVLCNYLENQNCTLKNLRLRRCKLPAIFLRYFLSILFKNENMKIMDLSLNESGDDRMNSSSENWRPKTFCMEEPRNKSMKILELQYISFEDKDVELLQKVLEKANCRIETLRLYSCKVPTPMGYQHLFSALYCNESLKTLDLSHNSFEEGEIKVLCSALENPNCKLEVLRLRHCKLPAVFLRYFLSILFKNENVKIMDLSLNESGDDRMNSSSENWRPQTFCLEELSNQRMKILELKYIFFEEGEVEVLQKILENANCRIVTLRLYSCKISTPLGYQHLFSVLQSNKSLKTLDLSYNSFEEGEIKVLCSALENPNCKLEVLSLTNCKLPDISCQYFLSTLLMNESLKVLNLSSSSFGGDTLKVFSEALRSENTKLQRLRFRR